jgi:hypothetical protein
MKMNLRKILLLERKECMGRKEQFNRQYWHRHSGLSQRGSVALPTLEFRKLPRNNSPAFGLKVYSDLVFGGKLGGLKEDKTYDGRTPDIQGDVEDNNKDRKNSRRDTAKKFSRPS